MKNKINYFEGRKSAIAWYESPDYGKTVEYWKKVDGISHPISGRQFANLVAKHKTNGLKAHEVVLRVRGGYDGQDRTLFIAAKSGREIRETINDVKNIYLRPDFMPAKINELQTVNDF